MSDKLAVTSQEICSNFAVTTKYKEHIERLTIGKIFTLIKEETLNEEQVIRHMSKLPAVKLEESFSEIVELLVEFFCKCPSLKVRDRIIQVTQIYPPVIKKKEKRGYFPLHHLFGSSKLDPDNHLLSALLSANPLLPLEYTVTGFGTVSPLHMVLMRGDIHYQALFLMLDHCPQSARYFTLEPFFCFCFC